MSKYKELKGVIHSPAGALKVINLSNFLSLISPKEISYEHEYSKSKVMVLVSAQPYEQAVCDELPLYKEHNVEVLVDMIPMGFNNRNRLELLRYYLLDQSRMRDISNKNLNQDIYDATHNYSYEYGTPTHLVRIAPRLWMVANPEDFVIFLNKKDNKIGLFVKDDKKTQIYSIHRGEPKTFRILGQN